MKLLQIPAIGMEQRIKQEIEENPALEVEGSEDQEDTVDDLDDEKEVDEFGDEVEIEDFKDKEEEFQVDDYLDTAPGRTITVQMTSTKRFLLHQVPVFMNCFNSNLAYDNWMNINTR